MKKILIVTPYCPFPPYKSGGIHALYNMIKAVDTKNKIIDLLYFDEKDIVAEKEIEKYLNKIYYINLKKNGIQNRVLSLLKKIPYGIYQYSMDIKFKKEYDLIVFDQELSIGLIDSFKAKKKILMAYDSMNLFFKRKYESNSKNLVSKYYNRKQSEFYENIHKKYYQKFDEINFVSKVDTEFEISKNGLDNKINTINLGVDKNKFNSEKYTRKKNKNIIFTGIMNYAPNKDAALYFAKNIMPKINEIDEEIKFMIVGKNPDLDVKKLESDNIKVLGFVDDIVKEICEASVYVSPLRYGSGMKNKILEAMSCSKAIVASTVSLDGINYGDKSIFLAGNDLEWVKYVVEIINNDKLNKEMGQKCRKIIEENYSWEKASSSLFN